MKDILILFFLLVFAFHATAQDNTLTLSGGYAFTNIKDADQNADGWRLYGAYEIQPRVGKLVHGFAVSYVHTSTVVTEMSGMDIIESKYTIGSIPFYYVPKLLIGEGSFQGFVKAAIGMQFSNLKRTGTLAEATSKDAGVYAGLGTGVTKKVNDNLFMNLEYEWGYLSNSYYANNFMHSVMLGFGFYLD
jgi:opacity protein-like surface antigen